jgi:hypothetical protein
MPARTSYDYAVIRIVPRVEREEFVNAGVVLFSKALDFLGATVALDEARLRALSPDLDLEMVHRHLEAFPQICAGAPEAGPIAKLSARERFHWLVAPRSTVIQVSPVHAGFCTDAASELSDLFSRLVAIEK